MADTAPEEETSTQRQARLRREKRNAKLAATGEDRLAKIKGLNGGVAPPSEVLGGPAEPASKAATVDDDPEEVDISSHPYTPASRSSGPGTPSTKQTPSDNPLQQAVMQMQAQQAQQQRGQAPGGGTTSGGEEDPMLQMMQQLMGQMPNMAGDNANGEMPQIPQMLQSMMGGGQQQKAPSGSAYVWRIVHAVFAVSIATYVALSSTFNGSKLARRQSAFTEDGGYGIGPGLFVIFATVQLVLQSSRFFLERGQLQGNGMIAMVANSGFVPEPYAGYIRLVGRYASIFTTIVSDAMVVLFVLGAMAWWNGLEGHGKVTEGT
ncbi:hypothetical protein MBLNU230_g2855t1 [Neophaeotheca triangularis]